MQLHKNFYSGVSFIHLISHFIFLSIRLISSPFRSMCIHLMTHLNITCLWRLELIIIYQILTGYMPRVYQRIGLKSFDISSHKRIWDSVLSQTLFELMKLCFIDSTAWGRFLHYWARFLLDFLTGPELAGIGDVFSDTLIGLLVLLKGDGSS